VFGGCRKNGRSSEWYDPKISRWYFGPKMIRHRPSAGIGVVKDNFVFAVGGFCDWSPLRSVEVLNLSSESPCWKPSVDMLVQRKFLGVGVINNYVYAVSYL